MTRIFTEGAEYSDFCFWTDYSPIGGGIISPAISGLARSGNYSYWFDGTGWAYRNLPSSYSEGYFREAVISNQNYGQFGLNKAPRFMSDGNELAYVSGSVGGFVTFYVNGGLVATGTHQYPLNPNFFCLDMYYKIADSGGRFVCYFDGELDIDYTGDTKVGAFSTFNRIGILGGGAYGIYLDDMAFDDTDRCYDGHVILLRPSGNGDTNNWTGNDADKVDNYLLVDEIPKDDDTTYVYSQTVGEQDMYNVDNYDMTSKIIRHVHAECRARYATAPSGSIKLGLKTGGSVYLSDTERALTSSYARAEGDDEPVDPSDLGNWAQADINALQFVAECE